MPDITFPCLVCGTVLPNRDPDKPNRPEGGLAFVMRNEGSPMEPGLIPGSFLFDPMDGSQLEIILCDACLKNSLRQHRILRTRDNIEH